MSWFEDAVFVGDSRTAGLRLYSGIKGADFLDYTGLSIYGVMKEKKVIRDGEEKISILEALARKQYAKVYISLGVNELGYFDPEGYAETYGQFIDKVRELQPDADIYAQELIPVNTQQCAEHKQADYVNNEGVANYNAALTKLCTDKEIYFVKVSEAIVDETGEPPAELTADGVHFQKQGYVQWRDYLLCHTMPHQNEKEKED